MNVVELIALLNTSPADAPVGVMTVGPSGMAIDVETGPVRTIESTIADDGTTEMVQVTGVGGSDAAAPSLITWACPCGS